MKGTVKVKASGGGSSGGDSGNGNGGASSDTGGTSTGGGSGSGSGSSSGSSFDPGSTGTLPFTGFSISPLALVGAILLLVGIALRLPAVRDRLNLL